MNPPKRTCIGCYQKDSKNNLIRLVYYNKTILIDESNNRPGRGAYLHKNTDCLAIALKRNNFSRAFKTTVSPQTVQQFNAGFTQWLMNKK